MTFDKWALRARIDERGQWLPIYESRGNDVANYLSEESGQSVSHADVLRFALEGRLALVVNVPTGTNVFGSGKDGERLTIEGLWDLPMEGAGRQQVEHDYHLLANLSPINIDGIEGAWVEQDGVRRQLDSYSNLPSELHNWSVTERLKKTLSRYPPGCVPGVRREALDALLAAMTARGERL